MSESFRLQIGTEERPFGNLLTYHQQGAVVAILVPD